jgi:proteasome lid subunit RPN8/RPN11
MLLQIPRRVYEEMVAHAEAERPDECCGFLAGRLVTAEGDAPAARVVRLYRLVNAEASPVLYDAEPKSLFRAHKDMQQNGLDLLAIYHSHPTSDPVPSRTDLARNFYGPDVVHVIVSLRTGTADVRAWRLGETDYAEAAWTCVEDG